ncbi:hypothetical protein D3C83_152730 [compost metagenome]
MAITRRRSHATLSAPSRVASATTATSSTPGLTERRIALACVEVISPAPIAVFTAESAGWLPDAAITSPSCQPIA